jgi:hypothetical protein
MAITLWRQTRPFEGITRWMEDLDRWFDFDIPELQETGWSPANLIGTAPILICYSFYTIACPMFFDLNTVHSQWSIVHRK